MSKTRCLLSILLAARIGFSQAAIPDTPKQPVIDEYHGVKVTDDYRWLEDWSNPETQSWSGAQNAYARGYLNSLPGRAQLHDQLTAILSKTASNFFSLHRAGGTLFALHAPPMKEQPVLVAIASVDSPGSERVILDPVQIDPTGHTTIDFYQPSQDGKYLAVSLSKGGSETGDLSIYETATGKPLSDSIPRVNGGTAGGSVAWTLDNSGFYYTRYPRQGERPEADINFYQQVWFHKLGTSTSDDKYSLGKDFPRIAEITLRPSRHDAYVLATMSNGDGGEFSHYIIGPHGEWTQLARFADRVTSIAFGEDGYLYLVSRQDAPRGKVLKLSLRDLDLSHATLIVPEQDISIGQLTPGGSRLYISGIDGGPSIVRIYDTNGKRKPGLPIEPNSSVWQMIADGPARLLFQNVSYVTPSAWYSFESQTGKVKPTALKSSVQVNYDDIEVSREFATSKDGTRIPLTILRKKSTPFDGNNPALLTAYGGYAISLQPFFDSSLRPLFDHGVVYAIANLRGGGEYGEKWHLAGNLTHKQNVFDDFDACARYLSDRHYTQPKQLAIEGGSNGGLLMGAAFTQHPDLYSSVVSMVGIYDMLRVELSPNGAFNVTEFGTVKEADQFKALYAYSPYHHVVDGAQYPAILFTTGANDPRVDPMNSRKMTARLQASGTKKPVLLRTSSDSGHGFGTSLSEAIESLTDVYAFLFAQWGIK